MNDEERNETPEERGPQEEAAREHTGPRRFYRSPRDRVIAGVAGGLGRYFRVDPIFFRIGFVALVVFGGVGVLLYGAAWLLVPLEGDTGHRMLDRPLGGRALTLIGAFVIVVAGLSFLGALGDHGWGWWWGGFLGPLALIAVAALLFWAFVGERDRSTTEGDRVRGGFDGGWVARRVALVIAVIAGSTVLFFGSALAAAAGGGAAVAALVIVIGALLVVAAFRGGARWLIFPALLLAIPTGVVSAADVDLDGGVGERTYRPSSTADLRDRYELGMGRLEIDLRDVPLPRGDRPLKVDLGIGDAVVVVPENVCVALDSRVGAGYVRLFDRDSAGLDVDWDSTPAAAAKVPRLMLDAEVGMGALHVVHDPSDVEDYADDSSGNVACERG
jgi:phage shock protein PspC (stress-responsive transcriptional regulator)/predicted membrane protein